MLQLKILKRCVKIKLSNLTSMSQEALRVPVFLFFKWFRSVRWKKKKVNLRHLVFTSEYKPYFLTLLTTKMQAVGTEGRLFNSFYVHMWHAFRSCASLFLQRRNYDKRAFLEDNELNDALGKNNERRIKLVASSKILEIPTIFSSKPRNSSFAFKPRNWRLKNKENVDRNA